jgi:molybdenum cofactor biosynthesis protein B
MRAAGRLRPTRCAKDRRTHPRRPTCVDRHAQPSDNATMTSSSEDFRPMSIAVLTVSDSRTTANDTSGDYLCEALQAAGHRLAGRDLLPDDRYRLRATVSAWIADPGVDAILLTGGTGFTGRDSTPEAIAPLLDREMPGFGEIFRAVSFEEIGTAALQSRALAGIANGTFIVCLPGSTSACRTGWERILRAQFDSRTRPCNLAGLRPRLRER